MSTEAMPLPGVEPARVQQFQLASATVGGAPTVVLVVGSDVYRLNDLLPEGTVAPQHLGVLLADWPQWHPVVTVAAARAPGEASPVRPQGWLPPVTPGKLVCIGTNYHGHLREMNTSPPALPYSFLKPVSTGLTASGASVTLPIGPRMVDWEAELAIVIGSRLHNVKGPEVLDAVAGYTITNDLSARDWIIDRPKEVGIDWVMMKGYDGFSPIGPYVTPKEFVADPQALRIRCWVNGELKQDSNTSDMVFGVQAILEHLAGIMTLEPGDVIATGTPAGVGFGRSPQQFLHDGDTVAVEIEGLGRLETLMVDQSEGAYS